MKNADTVVIAKEEDSGSGSGSGYSGSEEPDFDELLMQEEDSTIQSSVEL